MSARRTALQRLLNAALIAIAVVAVPVDAQVAQRIAMAPASPDTIAEPDFKRMLAFAERDSVAPWWAPLASLALPGSGQASLGQDRFLPYLAIEAYAWVRYANDRRDGERFRTEYRALARSVARSAFGPATLNGPFEYYERMEKWVESGAYDLVPGGTIDPETDTLTFNGAQWLLARRTFWQDPDAPPEPGSPEYLEALRFYRGRAIQPDFRWSWRDAQLAQDVFRRTIARSLRNGAHRSGALAALRAGRPRLCGPPRRGRRGRLRRGEKGGSSPEATGSTAGSAGRGSALTAHQTTPIR